MTGGRRYRLTAEGPVSLAVELDGRATAEEQAPPAGSGELVWPLEPTAADRARGVRRFQVLVDGWHFAVEAEPARQADLRQRATRAAAEHQPHVGIQLRAQIPGRVVRLWVAEGDEVQQGQPLLAVEAMKMENEIRAPHAGRIDGLRVEVGQAVERDDELLSIS